MWYTRLSTLHRHFTELPKLYRVRLQVQLALHGLKAVGGAKISDLSVRFIVPSYRLPSLRDRIADSFKAAENMRTASLSNWALHRKVRLPHDVISLFVYTSALSFNICSSPSMRSGTVGFARPSVPSGRTPWSSSCTSGETVGANCVGDCVCLLVI